MWDKAREQYETEREQLRELVLLYQPLIAQAIERGPSVYETGTLAAMLHSFYTGIENVLNRIAREVDGERLSGDMWHRQLLDRMAAPSRNRPAVLTQEMRDRLHEYLRFRHFSAMPTPLRWTGLVWRPW